MHTIDREYLLKILKDWPYDNGVAIDESHAMMIYGLVLAHKPERVVEFGFGSGVLTKLIIGALVHNGRGALTTVDNWHDWQGEQPAHAFLGGPRFTLCECDQSEFINNTESHTYDITISDANHGAEPGLLPELARITRPDGLIFVHDAARPEFRDAANRLGLPYFLFARSTLPHERNERGTIMILV